MSDSIDQEVLTRLRIGHTQLTYGSRCSGNTAYWQGCGQILDVTYILVQCPSSVELSTELDVIGSIGEVLPNDHNAEKAVIIISFRH